MAVVIYGLLTVLINIWGLLAASLLPAPSTATPAGELSCALAAVPNPCQARERIDSIGGPSMRRGCERWAKTMAARTGRSLPNVRHTADGAIVREGRLSSEVQLGSYDFVRHFAFPLSSP